MRTLPGTTFTTTNPSLNKIRRRQMGNSYSLPSVRLYEDKILDHGVLSLISLWDRQIATSPDQKKTRVNFYYDFHGMAFDIIGVLGFGKNARDPFTGKPIEEVALKAEVLLMVIAGTDTTSNTLTWIMLCLLRHPVVYQRLKSDIRAAFPSKSVTIRHDMARNTLPYLTAVIYEAMRLYPAVAGYIPRYVPQQGAHLMNGAYFLPQGTEVCISFFASHRNKDVWSSPTDFNPERFMGAGAEERLKDVLTFSSGVRICVGRHLAMAELYTITNMSTEQLKEYLTTAVAIAKEVGPAFTDGFWRTGRFAASSDFASSEKMGNGADCVTEVDRYIEKTIFSRIRQIYPKHKFVGEETTAESGDDYIVTDEPTWIVDPVDGTNNFVHHFPYTGVSIALAINKEPVMGVIYLPVLDELYTAARGQGAFMNGMPLPIIRSPALTTPSSLADCMILSEHGHTRTEEVMGPRLASFTRLLLDKKLGGGCVQNLRITGATCPDLTMVAKGVADVCWELGPHAWDFAAGVVILTEAGGAVFDGAGWWGKNIPEAERTPKPLNIWNRKILAIRYIPDLPNRPGSGREIQKKLAKEVLEIVGDLEYAPDGLH
ncbi:hypothetical protein H4217_006718 [Coemansia sp. RSA 1939]|nr:hypothetical protein H4217_006718 [Coemansia sp. RSA 1939]